jgi:hypothetical protein
MHLNTSQSAIFKVELKYPNKHRLGWEYGSNTCLAVKRPSSNPSATKIKKEKRKKK